MTLTSELAEWKRKKAEEQRAFDTFKGKLVDIRDIGSRITFAQGEIERIERVLSENPWTDEIHAEAVRHEQAEKSIMARYPIK